jgi:hypothetical protein
MLVLALAAACGGGNDNTLSLPPAPGGGAAPGGPAFDMSTATATVSGKITFEGTPPAPQRIQMNADPYCAQNATPETSTSEEVRVSDGGLENVIIYVRNAPAGSFAAPAQPVVLDQKGCHYTPHVFTLMAGQPLQVRNSDMTLHNVHVWAMTNTPVNIGQAVQGMTNNIALDKAEMPVPIRCDVHRWMNSFAGVFTHPFHTVSGAGGAYSLKLPPGSYEVVAWHEKYGEKTQMVQVGANETKDPGFSFSAAAAAD